MQRNIDFIKTYRKTKKAQTIAIPKPAAAYLPDPSAERL
jgi:hypothetical protein